MKSGTCAASRKSRHGMRDGKGVMESITSQDVAPSNAVMEIVVEGVTS